MTQNLPAAAGWYPDSTSGRERWWNGQAWTDQLQPPTREISLVGSGPLPAQTGAWHPDPTQPGLLRWWDGQTWTSHTAPAPPPGYHVQHSITFQAGNPRRAPRSVGVAFLLTFFFGPIGLLYASVTGGLVMIVVELMVFLLGILTLGLGWALFFVTWVICIIWGCIAAGQ